MWLGPDFRLKSPRLRTPEHPNWPKNSLNAVFAAHIVTLGVTALVSHNRIYPCLRLCVWRFRAQRRAFGRLVPAAGIRDDRRRRRRRLLVGNNGKAIKATLASIPTLLQGSRYTKDLYMEMMSLLFDVLSKVRKEGLMSIEGDIDSPQESPLFSKYPSVLQDHHIVEFMTDYLRLMVSGNMDAFQIENLMDNEIETHHHEGAVPAHCIAKVGDGLPAFGIVAAVMGVVHTMESVGIPPAELGLLIAQ